MPNDNCRCLDCKWEGTKSELAVDKVESCMGDDEIEICPECGSMNVFFI